MDDLIFDVKLTICIKYIPLICSRHRGSWRKMLVRVHVCVGVSGVGG